MRRFRDLFAPAKPIPIDNGLAYVLPRNSPIILTGRDTDPKIEEAIDKIARLAVEGNNE